MFKPLGAYPLYDATSTTVVICTGYSTSPIPAFKLPGSTYNSTPTGIIPITAAARYILSNTSLSCNNTS